jgi:hypothetical protein
VGDGVGDGGAVAAADLPGGPGEEEGFAGAREVAEEGEEATLVGVGEGFEVVEDEEGASAGEGSDEEARTLVGGGLGDLGLRAHEASQGRLTKRLAAKRPIQFAPFYCE